MKAVLISFSVIAFVVITQVVYMHNLSEENQGVSTEDGGFVK